MWLKANTMKTHRKYVWNLPRFSIWTFFVSCFCIHYSQNSIVPQCNGYQRNASNLMGKEIPKLYRQRLDHCHDYNYNITTPVTVGQHGGVGSFRVVELEGSWFRFLLYHLLAPNDCNFPMLLIWFINLRLRWWNHLPHRSLISVQWVSKYKGLRRIPEVKETLSKC